MVTHKNVSPPMSRYRQASVKIVDDLGHVEQTAVLFVRVGEAVVNLS